MTPGQQWLLSIILSAMGIIFIPTIILLTRAIIKWTRVEDRLDLLARDMATLIVDRDKMNQQMLKQMGDDRSATDKRLRWLEENIWKRRQP